MNEIYEKEIKAVYTPLNAEKKEIKSKRIKRCIIVISIIISLIIGIVIGKKSTGLITFENSKISDVVSVLNSKWLYANDFEDLGETLTDKALYGMTSFEDDIYTGYMSREELESFTSSINMSFVGIGIQFMTINGQHLITKVFKNSPAEKAGIEKGDILYSIDGEVLVGKTSDELKSLALGEEYSKAITKVIRNGEIQRFEIIRRSLDSSVEVELVDDVVYLQISSFGDNTANKIAYYLQDYSDYSKIVIDLRDNGGGYLESVIDIAVLFIGADQTVMQIKNKDDEIKIYNTSKQANPYTNFNDIVILINGNTASASEVLTLCLKESLDNVTVLGQKSYGKGVMQTTLPVGKDSAIKITTNYWLSPNGNSINLTGIIPDQEIADSFNAIIYQFNEDDKYYVDSVSEQVKTAQLALKELGYDVDRVDGYFSLSTLENINKFQSDNSQNVIDHLDYSTYNNILIKIFLDKLNNDVVFNEALKLLK